MTSFTTDEIAVTMTGAQWVSIIAKLAMPKDGLSAKGRAVYKQASQRLAAQVTAASDRALAQLETELAAVVGAAAPPARRPRARNAAEAIELAYGLIWHVPVDKATEAGRCASMARLALLEKLDRDSQRRGIDAARELIVKARTRNAPAPAIDAGNVVPFPNQNGQGV